MRLRPRTEIDPIVRQVLTRLLPADFQAGSSLKSVLWLTETVPIHQKYQLPDSLDSDTVRGGNTEDIYKVWEERDLGDLVLEGDSGPL